MIDTHVHLNIEEYQSDLSEVISRAEDVGVSAFICIGMDDLTNQKAIEITKKYPNVYASVGVHPGYCDDVTVEDVSKLASFLEDEKVVAIGECGIDLYWRQDNLAHQRLIFEAQIQLAITYRYPLIIHMRNSFEEIYDVLSKYQNQVTGVFHCFTGTIEQARQVLDLGFYIGVDGPITYKKNEMLRDIIRQVPLSKLLIETDGPFLSPVPHRGKRNEPAFVSYVAEAIASIHNVDISDVVSVTTENAKRLFFKIDKEMR